MDMFKKNTFNGKLLHELCVDIVNTLGFTIKHPTALKNIKILNRKQLNDYEELISFENRDITIYLISLVFRVNDKKIPIYTEDIHGLLLIFHKIKTI
jgi:hypothetical protein